MRVRVASAGTGKTTSLVRRYLDLLCQGTPLRRVAGVTFTRTAADELRQRVGLGLQSVRETGRYLDLCPPPHTKTSFEEAERELSGATLTTIHGFMREALRLVAPQLGLDPDVRSLGEWEASVMFEEELTSLLYLANDPKHSLYPACSELGAEAAPLLLHLFKQRSLTEKYKADEDMRNNALLKLFEAVYERYRVRLGARLLPPAEVERRALVLVQTKDALLRLAQRYHVVLVDEFQDVNPLQGRFFERLEASGIHIEVVGDPKQSIYGFRNADVEVFRRALETGEELAPLDQTRRHAATLTRFLNGMTRTFAEQNLGFSTAEAPEVYAAGEQSQTRGRVELHWVAGDAPVADLRRYEAQVLAEQLLLLSQHYPPNQMAVLAKSYAGLAYMEAALDAVKLPYTLLQGRGYYERIEVRDLYHALRVGIDPSGLSLSAWLRSPFAALSLEELEHILASEDPVARLETDFPTVFERLEQIREQVRATPIAALKFLIREPFIGEKRYVDFLEARPRENVDALLFAVAEQPPGEIEVLLERLDLLSRQAEAGDVPQSGEGISLLTVHRAKGLEWPVVAVFDLGRKTFHHPQPLYLETKSGHIALKGTPQFDLLKTAAKAREEEEGYRLLYVAASRARDVLVMSGSVKGEKPDGWAKGLTAMGLGAGTAAWERPDFVLKTWAYRPVKATSSQGQQQTELQPSAWVERTFPLHPQPPVTSPSSLKHESFEPLPLSDPEEGERLPGRSRTVGTLVHYAISQSWDAANPVHLDNLKAQEVMFPFNAYEQQSILEEVSELLGNYQTLLGAELPALSARAEDYPELPLALPHGATVWQGIIDRLYRVGERWILEDYKTDQVIEPERYHFQLAVYLKAIREVRAVTPQVQLVYLREKRVVRLEPETLEAAFKLGLGD